MTPPELLFLCHRVPYPPDKGEKIRAWHVLKRLSESHPIHLGCLADDPADAAHLQPLSEVCASVCCVTVKGGLQRLRAVARLRPHRPLTLDVFYSSRLEDWVSWILASRPIEQAYVFSSAMAEYLIGRQLKRRILDLVDIDSEKWSAYALHHPWPMRAVYRREAAALFSWERCVVLDFDHTLFVSQSEAKRFALLAPECQDRIGWLENGVDLEKFSPAHQFAPPFLKGEGNIVFTGTMDYWPNVDAVCWFSKQVLPILREKRPHLRFHIVGAKPTRAVLALRRLPGIIVTGRVADVRPYLAHADVAVVPLRIARGIQNKVLEAMAMARPVVATPEAFEGVQAVPGQDLLVCSGPGETAQRIEEVLNGYFPSLGTAARAVVKRNYRWSETLRRLDELFPLVTEERSGLATALPLNAS
jgi:sugar transferase (PEP-CTERM/EpsH1 system associated)